MMVLQQSDKVIVMDAHAFSFQERNGRETMIFQDRRQAGEKLAQELRNSRCGSLRDIRESKRLTGC